MKIRTLHSFLLMYPILMFCGLSTSVSVSGNEVFRPVTESVEIRSVGGITSEPGNALLLVRFRPDPRLGESISIWPSQGKVDLVDNGLSGDEVAGDGIYSAYIYAEPGDFTDGQEVSAETTVQAMIAVDTESESTSLTTIDPAKSLMITDLNVVESSKTFDPCVGVNTKFGAWTFARLVLEMVNSQETGIDPNEFITRWMKHWTEDQTINTFTVAARQDMSILFDVWPKTPEGNLILKEAPFRLLAIVNRVDLRDNLMFGPGDAGEMRLVFGAVDPTPPCNLTTDQIRFFVIFEFGVQKQSCDEVKAWAQQWQALNDYEFGSYYVGELQGITDQVVLRNGNPTQLPNKSALKQLRTNEEIIRPGGPIPGDSQIWELREFKLDSSTGYLKEVAVSQTPDKSLNKSAALADYINNNADQIVAGTHNVPEHWFNPETGSEIPFLGGSSLVTGLQWRADGILDNDARHLFAMNTCSGCHQSEFRRQNGLEVHFHQIFPRPPGSPSKLSGFLTGIEVPDAEVPETMRSFNELERRKAELDVLLNSSCFTELSRPASNSVH